MAMSTTKCSLVIYNAFNLLLTSNVESTSKESKRMTELTAKDPLTLLCPISLRTAPRPPLRAESINLSFSSLLPTIFLSKKSLKAAS